jgi:hypothetical protein
MLRLRSDTAADREDLRPGLSTDQSVDTTLEAVGRSVGAPPHDPLDAIKGTDGARALKTRSDAARLPFCRADAMSKAGTRDHQRHGGAHRRLKRMARG